MSLFDSIISKSVASVMASNQSLAGTNSTTLAQAGTSLTTIQQNATAAASASARSVSTPTTLGGPIQSMESYALSTSTDPSYQAAVKNAALNATNVSDSSFNVSLPGSNYTLFDIQNACGQAMADGVTSFGNNLQTIDPSIASNALTIGNSALPAARTASDSISASAYNAANQSVNSQLSAVNNSLASNVQAQNAAASAASSPSSSTSPGSSTTSNSASSAGSGVWAGEEGAPPIGNTTDVVYQNVKLYIEGVQVPYEAISISQNIGALPAAIIQVPPQAGLMDIARYYQPKVHVFYTDQNLGGDRLLFWGHITACNYAKSRQQGMATISFRCVHKNALMQQVILEWADLANNAQYNGGDSNTNAATAQVPSFNSAMTMITALKGLTGMQTENKDLISPSVPASQVADADPTKLAQRWAKFENRLVGMPAATMNLWNQLKKTCFMYPNFNTIMSTIYIPLVEDGLAFFDRLAGHYSLESLIQNSKQPMCTDANGTPIDGHPDGMLPPAFRLPSITAVSSSMAVASLTSQLGFSGEMASFAQLFTDFYLSVEYEMVTLASPASVPVDPTVAVNPDDPSSSSTVEMMAVETVVKPQIPFYYSPMCNVILPKMFHSISIQQDEEDIPTRVNAFHNLETGMKGYCQNYRGPNSIREAIAFGATLVPVNEKTENGPPTDLRGTTGPSYNIPGKYEEGRGIKQRKIAMPNWLAHMTADQSSKGNDNQETWPGKGTPEYNDLLNLYAAWVDRYGYDILTDENGKPYKSRNTQKDILNPYSTQAGILPFERLLFSSADYEYTKQVVQSRSGMIEGVFNPYIVPGYPMDVVDSSPNHPSFHGLCASVTHSISPRSIGTTIGIVGASTYAELSNYYIQPLHPWLQTALQMLTVTWGSAPAGSVGATPGSTGNGESASSTPPTSDSSYYGDVSQAISVRSTIVGNPTAKAAADKFYTSVFGVGAAAPDQMYDFSNGQAIPLQRSSGAWGTGTGQSTPMANGGEQNPYLTTVGNLRLVCRPIEGKNAIQAKFGVKFIDLTPSNYSPTGYSYQNPILSTDMLLEPGASLFLDYQETKDFVTTAKAAPATP